MKEQKQKSNITRNTIEKTKKKKIDQDLVTVLFIISMVVIIAFIFALFSNDKDTSNMTGTKAEIEKREEENTRAIVTTVSVTAIVITMICVGYKIKTNSKKRKAIEEKLKKQRELEEAINRINQKKNTKTDSNISVKSGRNVGIYGKDIYDEIDIEADKKTDRRGIRHKYDLNNIDEELEDEYLIGNRRYEDYEEDDSIQDIENLIQDKRLFNKWYMYAIIAAVIIATAIVLILL